MERVAQRDAWLNPPGLDEKELQKRTLTNLYDEEILPRLLALNLARAE